MVERCDAQHAEKDAGHLRPRAMANSSTPPVSGASCSIAPVWIQGSRLCRITNFLFLFLVRGRKSGSWKGGLILPEGYFHMTIIRFLPEDVRARLAELGPGLTQSIFHDAIKRGISARNTCSFNDPMPLVVMMGWGRTVRGVRDLLAQSGWQAKERMLSLTFSPDKRIALGVASGCDNTGQTKATPTTRWKKGKATGRVVKQNSAQISMFPDLEPKRPEKVPEYQTWVFLMRRVRPSVEKESMGSVSNLPALPVEVMGESFNDSYIPVEVDGPFVDQPGANEVVDLDREFLDLDPAGGQVLCELSLPDAFNSDTGRITHWHERLIFEPLDLSTRIEFDQTVSPIEPDETNVEIQRRKK